MLIRRLSYLTPVLEELSQFNIINSNDILNLDKRIESNGLYINIQPMELNDFDWDLYHSGDEEINNIFEEIYKNIKDKYGE